MQCKAMSKKVIALVMVGTIMTSAVPAYASTISKDETVYVTLDSEGKDISNTVSNWISSDEAIKNLKDKSVLRDVKNIKGDEKPVVENDYMIWNSDKKDLYYNGKCDKSLPLNVVIDYELNGKTIKPSDLVGKDGKVKITISIKNNEKRTINVGGTDREAYVPFTVAGTVILPTDKFSNVKVDGASMIDDGDKEVLAFAALPGLKESLQLENFDVLKDTMTIEADVKNFELSSMMFVATPEIPDIDEIDGVENIDELKEALNKLNDGGKALLEGANKLYDGEKTLNDNMAIFNDGVGKVDEGFGKLYGGLKVIGEKYPTIVKQGQELIGGVNDLNNGLKAYNGKFDMFLAKLDEASKGSAKVLAGVKKSQVSAKTLVDGKSAENKGISDLYENVEQLKAAIPALEGICATLPDEAPQKKQLQGLIKGLEKLDIAVKGLKGKDDAITDGFNQLYKALYEGDESLLNGVESLSSGISGLSGAGTKLKNEGSAELQKGSQKLADGVNALGGDNMNKLSSGVNTLMNGAEDLDKGIDTLAKGSGQLLAGSNQLLQGTGDLKNGADTLQNEGIGKLHEVGTEKISDIDNLIGVKDELVKLSKEYNSYSGIGEEMSGKVKFIMKTEEVKAEKKEETTNVEEKQEKKGFVAWIKSLFSK